LEMDVRNADSIQNAIGKIIANEGSLDVVINNAGIGITGAIEETPHQEILNTFDTNFNGPIHVIKAVLPQMRKQKDGLIINITSIAGYMGLPYRGIYSATKGALGLLTEALRMEVKEFGIHVTNLAPGDFATIIASGRYHAPIADDSYEDVDAGEDPILVAQKILKIIRTNTPKVHYKVGTFMQRFSLVLKNALPDKVYEKLLLNHYKL